MYTYVYMEQYKIKEKMSNEFERGRTERMTWEKIEGGEGMEK